MDNLDSLAKDLVLEIKEIMAPQADTNQQIRMYCRLTGPRLKAPACPALTQKRLGITVPTYKNYTRKIL